MFVSSDVKVPLLISSLPGALGMDVENKALSNLCLSLIYKAIYPSETQFYQSEKGSFNILGLMGKSA